MGQEAVANVVYVEQWSIASEEHGPCNHSRQGNTAIIEAEGLRPRGPWRPTHSQSRPMQTVLHGCTGIIRTAEWSRFCLPGSLFFMFRFATQHPVHRPPTILTTPHMEGEANGCGLPQHGW